MTRKDKKKREDLRRQLRWVREIALDHYLAGNAKQLMYWQGQAQEISNEIMMLYPRYRDYQPKRETRVVVPVFSTKKEAPTEQERRLLPQGFMEITHN